MGSLVESMRAVADANGRAVAVLQVQRYGERWNVTSMATQSDSTTDCELRVYRGGESPSALILTTYSGKLDTASGSPLALQFGDTLLAVWSGCSSGASCTLTLQGETFGR